MPAAPSSPLPPTVAERDAEIAALQTAFDEYIASSRELEEELDAELQKMQDKLSESSAANAALVSQLESINPQLSSLELALNDMKSKYEAESALRRQAELAQDVAEARAREAEGSLDALISESDNLHEQLAFREEEVEEMRLELEVEKERHKVEMMELNMQLEEAESKRKWGETGGSVAATALISSSSIDPKSVSTPSNKKTKEAAVDDALSAMSDEFGTVATSDGVINGDDNDDYVRRLEDELEDVTEQLIEAETTVSEMEDKIIATEKAKSDLEEKIIEMEDRISDLQLQLQSSATVNGTKLDNEKISEELALLNEELTLTQEELRAAEEDAKTAAENLENSHSTHKQELAKLQTELETVKGDARSAQLEVESLEKALKDANDETSALRDEVENLMTALENAKNDNEKALEEIETLQQAFDETEKDNQTASIQRQELLIKEHKSEIEELHREILSLKNSSETQDEREQLDINGGQKMDDTAKELKKIQKDLQDARQELGEAKRKLSVYEAAEKRQKLSKDSSDLPKKLRFGSPNKIKPLVLDEEMIGDDSAESAFFRTHARSRNRSEHSSRSRGRSSSPTIVERLEHDLKERRKKVNALTRECESLSKQKRMSDVRVSHLEEDVSTLHSKLQKKNDVPSTAAVSESSDEIQISDVDVDQVLNCGDKDKIASEFRALAKKSSSQKEHNAQLLVRILKLQGNIQVCCRVRPMWNNEIQKGMKRVVEPLSETEVGCFDSRTKAWKSYVFDKVWGPESNQRGIFQDVEPLALSVVDGYNACIFAYGQTGSGKTYTMEGEGKGYNVGISYRTIEKLFNLLQHRAKKEAGSNKTINEHLNDDGNSDGVQQVLSYNTVSSFKFSMKVGMLEIYNDEVYDLLDKKHSRLKTTKKPSLDIRRGKDGLIEVPGLTKENVSSLEEVITLLKRGNECRATATTNSNEHSSRSHMVLNVEVTSGIEGEQATTGNLFLVDLAGSERVRKSAVEGQELKEAGHINKSLAALGNVMEALDRKASHIPYRDSKLTYLLQDSLGGNSRTMMVVAVCPTSESFDESQHALQFATRVRRIHLGSAKRNVSSKNLEETVKNLSSELKLLAKAKERSEEQLQSLKRDHVRIQERLQASSESRKNSIDEARTVAVLRKNNNEMTARWQKEKQLRDQTSSELEECQNELKSVQSQLLKAQRDRDRLNKKMIDKEQEQEKLSRDLRKAKDATSAANLRARKAQMLQSRKSSMSTPDLKPPRRPNSADSGNKDSQQRSSTPASSSVKARPSSTSPVPDAAEIRSKVLSMLENHDPNKVGKVDAIMERFKGRESFLLEKMAARYESDVGSVKSTRSDRSSESRRSLSMTAQQRSEMALARHMERIRKKNAAASRLK